jgi:hypothetical protein
MADEKDKKTIGELWAEFIKRLPEEGPGYIGRLPGTLPGPIDTNLSNEQWKKVLENLGKLLEDPKVAAQKKAAETNQVDETTANEWFKEHWKDRTCGICKEVTWAMAPHFAHVPLTRIWRNHGPVAAFPCVVLTCRVCGNTLFFNANVMKLLPEGSE